MSFFAGIRIVFDVLKSFATFRLEIELFAHEIELTAPESQLFDEFELNDMEREGS